MDQVDIGGGNPVWHLRLRTASGENDVRKAFSLGPIFKLRACGSVADQHEADVVAAPCFEIRRGVKDDMKPAGHADGAYVAADKLALQDIFAKECLILASRIEELRVDAVHDDVHLVARHTLLYETLRISLSDCDYVICRLVHAALHGDENAQCAKRQLRPY